MAHELCGSYIRIHGNVGFAENFSSILITLCNSTIPEDWERGYVRNVCARVDYVIGESPKLRRAETKGGLR